jgi:hypothetical protein
MHRNSLLIGVGKSVKKLFSKQKNHKKKIYDDHNSFYLFHGIHDIIYYHNNAHQVYQGQSRGRGKFASKDLQTGPQFWGHSSLVLAQTSCSNSQQKHLLFGQGCFNSMHMHS